MTPTAAVITTIATGIALVLAATSLLLTRSSGVGTQHMKTSRHTDRSHVLPFSDETSKVIKFASEQKTQLEVARRERKTECGLASIFSTIDCKICILFIEGIKSLVDKGSTQEEVEIFATFACKQLKIEDDRVCDAIVQEFKRELFGVVTRLILAPSEVCGLALGTDCGAPYSPDTMWNVTFPDVPKPPIVHPELPKKGSPKLRLLHITDIHLDPAYTEGSNADCGEPLCCRANDGSPATGDPGAGRYGDYRNCDSPIVTLESLFQHLHSIQDTFDYVIFTGDIPPHNIWNQTRLNQLTSLQVYTNLMKKYLPNKMVYNTLGNHESAPVNSFPPPFITGNDSESWLYNAVADAWMTWLPVDTEATIKRGGFYSHSPYAGLRIISLNMNMCNNQNWWLYINGSDPAGMLQWLISELQDAENKQDKVHIIGHIMPGCTCCLKPFSWNYYKIVNRYESTIVEQFFGHSHADYYEMIYDDVTFLRPLGVVYIPGSITTYSKLNPGFRIYEIDGNYNGSTWRVQDYINYYMNLTEANSGGPVRWEKEYSAKEEYSLKSLFPKDWNDLIYRMKHNETLFQRFCRHNQKLAPNTCETCVDDCKKTLLCALKTGRNGDIDICNDL